MSNAKSESRRNFLKTSVVGAAGITLVGPLTHKAKAAEILTDVVDLSKTPINQDVDNLRVAFVKDTTMVRNATWGSFDTCNNPANTTTGVNYTVVKANMDKLACGLVNTKNPTAAWAKLLKIPASKTWATAKAALKVNAFSGNFPSVAVVAKICDVLIAQGMPAANICLLDGGASGVYSKYTGAGKQIPAGVTFVTSNGGNTLKFADNSTSNVAATLNTVDIIVDIAVNKGHDQYGTFGGVTMCQKNHYWTFGNFGHDKALTVLARNNRCDHLLGKIPTSYPAKQQLCIVDSLWAGVPGKWEGNVDDGKNVSYIVMGTMAGAVDYVTTMNIRKPLGGNYAAGGGFPAWNQTLVDRYITDYGYAAASKTTVTTPQTGAGAGLVDASGIVPDPVSSVLNINQINHGYIQVSVFGNGVRPVRTNVNLNNNERAISASIFDMKGKVVRKLEVSTGGHEIVWDARDRNGGLVNSGNYVIKVTGERTVASGVFSILK